VVHVVNHRKKEKNRTRKKWCKRRSAVEPIIGHLKSDFRLNRHFLKGKIGDAINARLAGCGHNL
jgi:IS5 family transposase